MLKKLNTKSLPLIVCLFGFILSAALPALADSSSDFQACKDMKWKDGKKAKKNCFRDLAAGLIQEIETLTPTSVLWVDRETPPFTGDLAQVIEDDNPMCMGNGGCFLPFGFVPCVATPEQDIGPPIRLQCVINKVTESPIDHDSVGDFNPADGLPPEYEVLDAPFDSVSVLFLTGPDARDPIVLINSIY